MSKLDYTGRQKLGLVDFLALSPTSVTDYKSRSGSAARHGHQFPRKEPELTCSSVGPMAEPTWLSSPSSLSFARKLVVGLGACMLCARRMDLEIGTPPVPGNKFRIG